MDYVMKVCKTMLYFFVHFSILFLSLNLDNSGAFKEKKTPNRAGMLVHLAKMCYLPRDNIRRVVYPTPRKCGQAGWSPENTQRPGI